MKFEVRIKEYRAPNSTEKYAQDAKIQYRNGWRVVSVAFVGGVGYRLLVTYERER